MANHASALKRVKQAKKRRLRNKSCKSTISTAVKKVLASVDQKDADGVKKNYAEAVSRLDSAVTKGILHRRTASRKISRLTKKVSQLSA
ncbi:MAG TPA: 30S ribosomal protein S20 [Deltaproteobacteria bacterium]|nr:30S ribosomal protein S20 [Deltaproteobacteria bacterium]HOI07967.1 30S ribosomal protein S20 [Deltaproteobacteria bacterium]